MIKKTKPMPSNSLSILTLQESPSSPALRSIYLASHSVEEPHHLLNNPQNPSSKPQPSSSQRYYSGLLSSSKNSSGKKKKSPGRSPHSHSLSHCRQATRGEGHTPQGTPGKPVQPLSQRGGSSGEKISSSLMRKYKSIEKIREVITSHREHMPSSQKKRSVSKHLKSPVGGQTNIQFASGFHVPTRNKKVVEEKEMAIFIQQVGFRNLRDSTTSNQASLSSTRRVNSSRKGDGKAESKTNF